MARAKQPVSVAGIQFDALIAESRGYEATVPQYVVESGYQVSDDIIIGAETLEMTLFLTDTPVTWRGQGGSGRIERVVKQLEELYYSKTPVTVVTSDKTFTSMAIVSMTISKSVEIGYSREVPISFQKIRTTSSKTTSIPDSYGKSGATQGAAGTASTSTENASSGSSGGGTGASDGGSGSNGGKSSILYGAAQSIGLIS